MADTGARFAKSREGVAMLTRNWRAVLRPDAAPGSEPEAAAGSEPGAAAGSEPGAVAGTTPAAAPPPPPAPAQAPQDAAEWLRANGLTTAAVVLIAVQLWWSAALLAHTYFRQDDFRTFDRALANGFGWHYLMLVDAGHMAPLNFAVAWVLARVALYNWLLAGGVILLFVAAASFALLRVLRTLFGNRWAILIPLGLYLFSPLALAGVGWWSLAIETLPLDLAVFMALHAHIRYLRGGRLRDAAVAGGWLLLGMATMEKGVVIPLLLLAVTSGFFVEGRWAAATLTALIRYRRAWLLYGTLVAGYCVLFFLQLPTSRNQPGSPGSFSRLIDFVSSLVGTTLLPGVAGGPWRWLVFGSGYAEASPPPGLQQLSWILAVAVVIISCVYRVRAWRAWAILAGWIAVADILPVAIGRVGGAPPALLGMQARYLADGAPIVALCAGLAFLPVAGRPETSRFQLPASPVAGLAGALTSPVVVQRLRILTAVLLGALLIGSFWSLTTLEAATNTRPARSYIATAQVAVAQAPRGTLIVNTPTPAMIMDPIFFWTSGHTSQVIGAIARGVPGSHLNWTLSPRGVIGHLMIFDSLGRLWPVTVEGPASGPPPQAKPAPAHPAKHPGQKAASKPAKQPARNCWAVTAGGVRIPLHGSLYRWPWTARLSYSGPATVLAVSLGELWRSVPVPAGTHAVYVPVTGSGKVISVRQLGAAPGSCVTGVTVGSLQPDHTGAPIPATPVAG
jgi:hypothetical protein